MAVFGRGGAGTAILWVVCGHWKRLQL